MSRNRMMCMILIVTLALSLCACAGYDEEAVETELIEKDGNVEENSRAINSSVNSDEARSKLVGTYVGSQGSGLTLYKDGKADYYYNGWGEIEEDDIWGYDDGVITFYSFKLGCDIYAEVDNDDVSELIFQSDSTAWDEEPFIKVSSVASDWSVEDYDRFLETSYGITSNKDITEMLEFGGFCFAIPSCFDIKETEENAEDGMEGVSYYAGETKNQGVGFISVNLDGLSEYGIAINNNEQFIDAIVEELYGDSYFESVKTVNVGGIVGREYDKAEEQTNIRMIVVYNENENKIVVIVLVKEETAEYDYDTAFDTMIQTATLISGDSTTNLPQSSSEEQEEASKSSNGVDPELKAFLDSYEAFMDEYINFMKNYQNSDNVFDMLSDYMNILSKYSDFAEKIDAIDEDELSAEDLAYYLEVTARVLAKMAELY